MNTKPTMNIYAKKGDMVTVSKYSAKNGYKGDIAQVKKYLKIGGIYTVLKTDVDEFGTDVYLKEFPNKTFNSVNFEDYKDDLTKKNVLLILKKELAEIPELLKFTFKYQDSQGYARLKGQEVLLKLLIKKFNKL